MTADAQQITVPGVYDIPAEQYHADPVPGGSLSSTGARKLLPPSCPARYRWWVDNGQHPKPAWDIGHAAHKVVLGAGPGLARVEGTGASPEDWRTNADKAAVAAVRATGGVPLKPSAYEAVHAMADAIRAHPLAAALFTPRGRPDLGDRGTGLAEQTLIWQDQQTGVWCRALLDYLPWFTLHTADGARPATAPAHPGRLIIPEYKTAASLEDDAVERAIHDRGYHIQLAWYLAGVRALGLAGDDARAVLVMQEKTPPYLIRVVEPPATTMRIAAAQCRHALHIYAACVASGQWPGYSDDVDWIGLPSWAEYRLSEEYL